MQVCRKLGIMRWPFRSSAAKFVQQNGQLLPLLPQQYDQMQHQFQFQQQPPQLPNQAAFVAAAAAANTAQPQGLMQGAGFGEATLNSPSGGSSGMAVQRQLLGQQGQGPQSLGQLLQALASSQQAAAEAGAGHLLPANLQQFAAHLQQQQQQQQALQQQHITIVELLQRLAQPAAPARGPPAVLESIAGMLPPSAAAGAPAFAAQLTLLLQGAVSAPAQQHPQSPAAPTANVLHQLLCLARAQPSGQHQQPAQHQQPTGQAWAGPSPKPAVHEAAPSQQSAATAALQPAGASATATQAADVQEQAQLLAVLAKLATAAQHANAAEPPVLWAQAQMPSSQEEPKQPMAQAHGMAAASQVLAALMGSFSASPTNGSLTQMGWAQ